MDVSVYLYICICLHITSYHAYVTTPQQGPTWSSMEYGGKWKALHYVIKRIYNPVMLSCFEDKTSSTIDLYLTSDLPPSLVLQGDVTVQLLAYNTTDGVPLKEQVWT